MLLCPVLHDKCNLHHHVRESVPARLLGERVEALERESVSRWHCAFQRKRFALHVVILTVVCCRVEHVRVFGGGERAEDLPAVAEEALRRENVVEFRAARSLVRAGVLRVVLAVAHELGGPRVCVENGDGERGLSGLRVRALAVWEVPPDVVCFLEQLEQQQRLKADNGHERKRDRVRFDVWFAFGHDIRGPEFCDAVAENQSGRHGVRQKLCRKGQLDLVMRQRERLERAVLA